MTLPAKEIWFFGMTIAMAIDLSIIKKKVIRAAKMIPIVESLAEMRSPLYTKRFKSWQMAQPALEI